MCKKIALNHQGDLNAAGSSDAGAVFNLFTDVAAAPKKVKAGKDLI